MIAIHAGKPLIERGGGDNDWDTDMVFPSSWIITRGKDYWIYNSGANERHDVAEIFQPKRDISFGLAKLPLDRFAGLTAGEKPGSIITKPFKLSAAEIAINAHARNGEISIDVHDVDGQPITELSGVNAVTLKDSDELAWRAEWKPREFTRRVGQMVRLRFRVVPILVAHDGVVYCIGGRSGGSLAVRTGGTGDVTETHRLWTGKKGSNVSSPVFHDGHLYWMHDNQGIAYCAEARTGKIVYEERVDGAGPIYASAVLADGKVYYVSRYGCMMVVPASPKYEQLAVNEVGDESTFNASPAIAGNSLFIRSDRHLYCIGKQ